MESTTGMRAESARPCNCSEESLTNTALSAVLTASASPEGINSEPVAMLCSGAAVEALSSPQCCLGEAGISRADDEPTTRVEGGEGCEGKESSTPSRSSTDATQLCHNRAFRSKYMVINVATGPWQEALDNASCLLSLSSSSRHLSTSQRMARPSVRRMSATRSGTRPSRAWTLNALSSSGGMSPSLSRPTISTSAPRTFSIRSDGGKVAKMRRFNRRCLSLATGGFKLA
mmetsp:Transcript_45519/g.121831  ORF Transcript_45519/g.121831 Transcript_45519/m.121831 type:complete len:230 (-) Transcript_45519:363-1052(-)